MTDKDQQAFVKQQAAIKAAHDRRVVAQRKASSGKGSKGGKKK